MKNSWFLTCLLLLTAGQALAAPPRFRDAHSVVIDFSSEPAADSPMLQPAPEFRGSPGLRLEEVEGGYEIRLSQGQPLRIRQLNPRSLSLEAPGTTHLFGLGQQFLPHRAGQTGGDWLGEQRFAGASLNDPDPFLFGNKLVKFQGGTVGNTQFPVLYGYRPEASPFVLFLDNVSRHHWDLRGQSWKVEVQEGPLKLVVSMADDLPTLRRRYMQWVGRPPVPPSKAFGLWVSEYGYDNWQELLEKLTSLRRHHFPVEGFVLDLQWFGGIEEGSPRSQMGTLSFDLKNFPNPAQTVAQLWKAGIGLVVIEEAYIAADLEEHRQLAARGFLARQQERDQPQVINQVPWWGIGGMLDFTHPEAGDYWHQWKRKPLVEMGILGHWTDLGEPEMFLEKDATGKLSTPRYHVGGQSQAHNLFNLLWSKSIFDAYARSHPDKRPWILSRSGTSGSQRYGVAMWSGDIASNYESLGSHLNAQMHMSWSGIDYFGSDIGGFFRKRFRGTPQQLDELYTRWFAIGSYLDVPVRPHTMNLENRWETAPDRVGHRPSNLANLQERDQLFPYYYSLAHQAHRLGDPLVAPLAYWYPQKGRWLGWNGNGDQKLIGQNLMVVAEAQPATRHKEVFLPAGVWYDFRSGERLEAPEGGLVQRALFDGQERFRPPLLARAGAIVPTRKDWQVFVGSPGEFTLIEDDGQTNAYLKGEVRETRLRQGPGEAGTWEMVLETRQPRRHSLELIGLKKVASIDCQGEALSWRPSQRGLHVSLPPGEKLHLKVTQE